MPVVQPCVDAADIPAIPRSALRADADVNALAAGAEVDIRELRRVAKKQQALLQGCSK